MKTRGCSDVVAHVDGYVGVVAVRCRGWPHGSEDGVEGLGHNRSSSFCTDF